MKEKHPMTRCPRYPWSRFIRGAEGVGLIEFAFALPVLLILFAGVIELTRLVLANQKVDKTATSLADFLGQQEDPGDFNINTLDSAFSKLLDPFDSAEAGYIVTGVSLDEDGVTPRIVWQNKRGKHGTSAVGQGLGDEAEVNGVKLQQGEQIVAAEVFYTHATILDYLGGISEALEFDGRQLYKLAISLKRVPDQAVKGKKQAMPNQYGCCGQYCKQGDPLNATDTDWLPTCACFKFGLCEYLPTHSKYNETYETDPQFPSFPNYPTVTRGEHRKFILDHYNCPNLGPCADPPPDPCVAANNCPPEPPCNTCACDSSLCKSGGV